MSLKSPNYLSKGQTIGVMAPSSFVEKEDIEKSAERLKQAGYSVFVHPQTYERNGQSAGDILQKSLALQGLWMRKDIDAIWFAGGGNQSLDLLGSINFENLKKLKSTKTVIGFSDNTTLINMLPYHVGISAFHAPVFKQLHGLSDANLETCLSTLQGQTNSLAFTADNILNTKNTNKEISGNVIGGNLSLMQYIIPLLPEDYLSNSILLLEDCNEETSRIDRMLSFMRQYGVFKKVQAVIFGEFSDLQDTGRPFGKTLDEIISAHTSDCDIPVINGISFGHTSPYNAFPVGASATLDLNKNCIKWS